MNSRVTEIVTEMERVAKGTSSAVPCAVTLAHDYIGYWDEQLKRYVNVPGTVVQDLGKLRDRVIGVLRSKAVANQIDLRFVRMSDVEAACAGDDPFNYDPRKGARCGLWP